MRARKVVAIPSMRPGRGDEIMQCGLEEKDDWSVELAVGIELDLDDWDIFGFLSFASVRRPAKTTL